MNPSQKELLQRRLRGEASRIFDQRSPALSARISSRLRGEPVPRSSASGDATPHSQWTAWLRKLWLPALVTAGLLCVVLFGWRLPGPANVLPDAGVPAASASSSIGAFASEEAALRSAGAFTSQLRGLMGLEERLLASAASLVPEEELLRVEALKVYDDATRVASELWAGLPSDWMQTLTAN